MTDLNEYIEQHSSAENDALQRISHDTNVLTCNAHMLSGHVQGRLLAMLSKMLQPRHILELGTFTGYSALCLAEGLQAGGTLDTIERNDELEEMIRSNLALSSSGERIRLHIGDAKELLRSWQAEKKDFYELIFVDADKREYSAYYELALPLLRPGGFMLADNTLWDGHVVDPHYERDWQTRSLRAFNDMVANDNRVEKVIGPIRDGLTIIRKKE